MENTLVSGFASCYFNHPAREFGFINSISVIQPRQGRGLGSLLLEGVAQYARANSFKQIRLEVFKQNRAAIDFYYKHRFIILNDLEEKVLLGLNL
jgi:ribosomal protein S18 acetylase RimI-like enzyme